MTYTANTREYKGFTIERNRGGYEVSKDGQFLVVTTHLYLAKRMIDRKVA